MPKKSTKKKRMTKAVAAALKAMENMVYDTEDLRARLQQLTPAGLDAKWDWGRVTFIGRDLSGAGWIQFNIGLRTKSCLCADRQCQWLIATVEPHTHIYAAAEFHADHHSVSSSVNHSKG
jgi:hypothetical protein